MALNYLSIKMQYLINCTSANDDTSGDVIDAHRFVTDVTISNVVVFCAIASVNRF